MSEEAGGTAERPDGRTARSEGHQVPNVYAGLLLAEESRLRALPAAVELSMRMRVDALVYAADAISTNWQRLRARAASIGPDVDKLGFHGRADMLSAAWSIVDELDGVRQLVQGMVGDERPGPNTSRLLAACALVRTLRNHMRHLSGNLRNIAAQKGQRSALFGALSWLWWPDATSTDAHIVLLQSGMIHGGEAMPVVNPAGRKVVPPADLFQLNAFGVTLMLGEPIEAFEEWLRVSEVDWINQLEAQFKSHVAANGGDEADLWKHSGGGYAFALGIQFNPAVPLPEEPESSDEKSRASDTEAES